MATWMTMFLNIHIQESPWILTYLLWQDIEGISFDNQIKDTEVVLDQAPNQSCIKFTVHNNPMSLVCYYIWVWWTIWRRNIFFQRSAILEESGSTFPDDLLMAIEAQS